MGCESIRLDLLELHGRQFVIEHFLNYYKASQKEMAYKIYMSDLLWGFVDGSKRGVPRYYDIISDAPVEEERTPEEIIEHVKMKLRGQV